jgi:hypothetical protein
VLASMIHSVNRRSGRHWFQGATLGLFLFFVAGCGGSDGVGPSSETPAAGVPAEPATTPVDSTGLPSGDSLPPPPSDSAAIGPSTFTGATAPGIVFGTFNMMNEYFNTIHTGALRGGISPGESTRKMLADAQKKGARLVIKLCGGKDSFVLANGTFSLTKWKEMVVRFKDMDLNSYIADGTILGHYLIDEPHRAERWGKVISQATLEAMAKYSKQLWPNMTTMVRVKPSWLAQAPITYTNLDAAWTQYEVHHGDVTKWATTEVAAAKLKGLGLVAGLNVIAGGNGSSGLPRLKPSWPPPMSANEVRSYGNVMLSQAHMCGFFMWMHDLPYYGRSDIKSAMAELSSKAKAHAKTSCQQ